MILICFFTWRVFRPDDPGARAICLGLSAILVAAWATEGLVRGFHAGAIDGWLTVVLGLRGLGFAWAGIESARYWLQLRRRQRLGLADPLLVNRFLLQRRALRSP